MKFLILLFQNYLEQKCLVGCLEKGSHYLYLVDGHGEQGDIKVVFDVSGFFSVVDELISC